MYRLLVYVSLCCSFTAAQNAKEIQSLKASLDGTIVQPGDSSYKKESLIWNNRRCGSHPAGIVLPESYQDVQKAMRFFNTFNIKPTIKSGGHAFTGWNQRENGWVISTRRLDKLEILKDQDEIILGAGLRFHQIYKALDQTKYLFPGGTCPTVGVSGFLLGGGHSAISRSVGAGSDLIQHMQVVTAAGDLIQVNATSNSDLFWALRGAGHNNFGVVVEFRLQLPRASESVSFHGELQWRLASQHTITKVVESFIEYTGIAPKEMTLQLQFFPVVTKIAFFYVGDPDAGRKELRRFKHSFNLPKPHEERSKFGSQWDYVNLNPSAAIYPVPTRTFVKAAMYAKLTREFAQKMVRVWYSWSLIRGIPAVVITVLGGKLAEISEDSSAVAHRQAMYSVEYTANWWSSRGDAKWINRILGARDTLEKHVERSGHYVNYLDAQLQNWEYEYYGNHTTRLQQIKDKWDPHGVFEFPQGVYTSTKKREIEIQPVLPSSIVDQDSYSSSDSLQFSSDSTAEEY